MADLDPQEQWHRDALAERHQPHPEHIPTTAERVAAVALLQLLELGATERATEQRRRAVLRLIHGEGAA